MRSLINFVHTSRWNQVLRFLVFFFFLSALKYVLKGFFSLRLYELLRRVSFPPRNPRRKRYMPWVEKKKKKKVFPLPFLLFPTHRVFSGSLVADTCKHVDRSQANGAFPNWEKEREKKGSTGGGCFSLTNPSQRGNISRFNCCWHSFDAAEMAAEYIGISKASNLQTNSAVIKKTLSALQTSRADDTRRPRAYESNNHFSYRPPSLSFPAPSLFCLIGSERRSDERARRDGRTMDRLWQKKTEKGRGSVRQSRLTESMSRVTGQTGFLIAFRAYFSSKALVIGHERRW